MTSGDGGRPSGPTATVVPTLSPDEARLGRDLGVARLTIIVAGGLMILQSSQGLGPPKIAYLAIAAVVLLASLHGVWRRRQEPMVDAAHAWLLVSASLIALIAISLPVALVHGTSISQWVRDAATYGLYAAAPIFAIDAAASMRRGWLLALLVACASLGALSFGINWIALRNLAALPFDQLVLPTASLPTVLFLVSLAAAIVDRPRRVAWVVLGGATLGVFLLSGTRSALFILVAVPVIVALAGRARLRRSISASVGVTAVAAVLVLTIQAGFVSASRELPPPIDVATASWPIPSHPGGAGFPPTNGASTGSTAGPRTARPAPKPTIAPPPPNPDANIVRRIQDFLASPQRDGSIRERLTQYGVAWDLFASSPIVGVGLGHPIEWHRLDGSTMADFTADTPLVLPAKLGLLGLAWVFLLAIVWLHFVRRLLRAGLSIPGLVMAGWTAVLVALLWTGFSVEDKGFSFAVMLILALGFIEIERARSSQT